MSTAECELPTSTPLPNEVAAEAGWKDNRLDSTRGTRQSCTPALVAAFKRTGWRVEPATGCLLWQGGTNGDAGYGYVTANGTRMLAHRLSLELTLGRELGEGMLALHSCDTPLCCSPLHLREATPLDNMLDRMERSGYFGATKTHCSRGHEYTAANTRTALESDGRVHRRCRVCERARQRAARAEARA